MATVNLSNIKLNWRGDYSAATTYTKNDAVFFQGSSFSAKTTALGQAPLTSPGLADGTRITVTVVGSKYRLTAAGVGTGDTPNLTLVRGRTYYFDFSAVPTSHSFALRLGVTNSTDTVMGASPNRVDVGFDTSSIEYTATYAKQVFSTANKVITYTVPFADSAAYSTLYYVSVDNTSNFGTITLIDPSYVEVNSAFWSVIARDSESFTTTRGDLVFRNAGDTTRLPAGVHNQILTTQGSSADPTWTDQTGREHNIVQMSTISPLPFGTEQTTSANLITRRGRMHGWGPSFWVMPDRRSAKSSGWNRQNGLGFHHYPDTLNTTTYPGQRWSTPQYVQFFEKFADDERINYITRWSSGACIVTNRGRVYFTGYNGYGQFGFGDTNNRMIFTRNAFFGDTEGRTVVDIQHTRSFSGSDGNNGAILCLTAEGELWGAGYNAWRVLGQNDTTNRSVFTRIGESTINRLGYACVGFAFSQAEAYGSNVIAWNSNNEYYGWGDNQSGELGFTNQNAVAVPTRMSQFESVITVGSTPVDVIMNRSNTTTSTTRYTNAILMSDGHIYTSGRSNHGQLGTNVAASTDSFIWARVNRPAGKTFTRLVAAGGESATLYGLTSDGFLYAWGLNNYRQIGDNSTTNRLEPTLCSNLPAGIQGTITNVWAQGDNSYTTVWCATSAGRYFSWGWYGSGSITHSQRPNQDPWETGSEPFEITTNLPYAGVGLVDVHPLWVSSSSQAWFLRYSNGEVFACGYNDYEGWNPAGGDSTGYATQTAYRFNYPRLLTNIYF
jgi:alpha-tubulin suppressor-like RCC1 family protein